MYYYTELQTHTHTQDMNVLVQISLAALRVKIDPCMHLCFSVA